MSRFQKLADEVYDKCDRYSVEQIQGVNVFRDYLEERLPAPFDIVDDFERALCKYTGAPYAVAVNSCTNALLLACVYLQVDTVFIPKRTYVGVAQSILNAGGKVKFDDREWRGSYQLYPYQIYDSARRFTANMYLGGFQCVSFHVAKVLGIDQGGAILHDDPAADRWFRRARFDGRTPGVAPKDDTFVRGFHCYMSPPLAAMGLWRMNYLPERNPDLPNDQYGDLSLQEVFNPTNPWAWSRGPQ